MTDLIKDVVYHEDCLSADKTMGIEGHIPNHSIDMILCDMPTARHAINGTL